MKTAKKRADQLGYGPTQWLQVDIIYKERVNRKSCSRESEFLGICEVPKVAPG